MTEILIITESKRHMNVQLLLILVGVLRDVPLNIVMHLPDIHGFEQWRRCTVRCGLTAAGLFRSFLREQLNPPKPTAEGFIESREWCPFDRVRKLHVLASTRQKNGSH